MAMQIEIRCAAAGRGFNMMRGRIGRRGFILAWLPLFAALNAGTLA
jgi:hypothetical protein